MAEALRVCPICRSAPSWYAAGHTSAKRGVHCAILRGCRHADALGLEIVEAPAASAVIDRWNTEAERLLTMQTERWTMEQRAAFRQRLGWPA